MAQHYEGFYLGPPASVPLSGSNVPFGAIISQPIYYRTAEAEIQPALRGGNTAHSETEEI
jgi:hypothetical protein